MFAHILIPILLSQAAPTEVAPTTIAVDPSRTWIVCEHYHSHQGRCDAFEADTMTEALRAARALVGPGPILSAQSLRDAKAGRE